MTDDELAVLPRFPTLREIMPMDVPDAGFRHVGNCQNLEGLWCMYCRDTGDDATKHLQPLARLKTYYAGMTQITDRSLAILSRMNSLERLEFWACQGITDEGVLELGRLPKLREITVNGSPGVSRRLGRVRRRRFFEVRGLRLFRYGGPAIFPCQKIYPML